MIQELTHPKINVQWSNLRNAPKE